MSDVMDHDFQAHLSEVIERLVQEQDADVFGLTFRRNRQTIQVDVIIDLPRGGITIDQCSKINKALVRFMEEDGSLGDQFVLEVSSPGVDRPLKTPKDFRRVIGRKIKVHLQEKISGKCEHDGCLTDVIDEGIVLETRTETLTVPLVLMTKAVQIIDIE